MGDYNQDSIVKLEMQNSNALRRPFDPTAHDLEATFRLTRFADLKGRGCKVPQEVLGKLTTSLQQDYTAQDEEAQYMHMAMPRIGIGLDCSVTPIRHGGLCLVQTTDFFYPIVDDPYMMGKIACANVLSDLYAMGVIDCDNMLMLLAVSTKMTEKERDVVIPLIMRGFKVGMIILNLPRSAKPLRNIDFFCSSIDRTRHLRRAHQSPAAKVLSIHGVRLVELRPAFANRMITLFPIMLLSAMCWY